MTVNPIPFGYHVTKHLADGSDDHQNTNALIKLIEGNPATTTFRLTKTIDGGAYKGARSGEIDGFVVPADTWDESKGDSANVLTVTHTSSDGVEDTHAYDLAGTRELDGYHIGYTDASTSSIMGYVLMDANDDGRFDETDADGNPTGDERISDARVGLRRSYLKRAAEGEEDQNVWVSDNGDSPETVNGVEFLAVETTDADGFYSFDDLETHAPHGEHSDQPELYAYEVFLLLPEDDATDISELAATYYQANNSYRDSALVATQVSWDELNRDNDAVDMPEQPADFQAPWRIAKLLVNENGDRLEADKDDPMHEDRANYEDGELYYVLAGPDTSEVKYFDEFRTVIAQKIHDLEPGLSDVVNNYDCTVGTARRYYNAILTTYEYGSISGTVFNDIDYDGLDETEPDKETGEAQDSPVANALLGLKRYRWIPVEGEANGGHWELDQRVADADADGSGDAVDPADPEDPAGGVDPGMSVDPEGNVDAGMSVDPDAGLPEGIAADDYVAFVRTENDGSYTFGNLPTHLRNADGTAVLYGYEVEVLDPGVDADAFAVTKYQEGSGTDDSALTMDGLVLKSAGTELLDGKIVVAQPMSDVTERFGAERTWVVDDIYQVAGYDVVHARDLGDYNAGYTSLEFGELAGAVFDDADFNGAYEPGVTEDAPLEGVVLGLRRFAWVPSGPNAGPADGAWVEDEGDEAVEVGGSAYYRTLTTGADGLYRFDELPTHENRDGANVLFGYELWVVQAPGTLEEPYAVTRYQTAEGTPEMAAALGADAASEDGAAAEGGAEGDAVEGDAAEPDLSDPRSAVRVTGQVIKADTALPEMKDGKIVMASAAGADVNPRTVHAPYLVGGYNVVSAVSLTDYHAGYTKQQKGIISGYVFEDGDYNGQFETDDNGTVTGAVARLLGAAVRTLADVADGSVDPAAAPAALADELAAIPVALDAPDTALSGAVLGLKRYRWETSGSDADTSGADTSGLGSSTTVNRAENDSVGTEDNAASSGRWVLDTPAVGEDEAFSVLPDGMVARDDINLTDFVAFVQVDEDGAYEFTNVETHATEGSGEDMVNTLYGYEVYLVATPEGSDLAATRRGIGANEALMSALQVNSLLDPLQVEGNPQLKDGKLVLACPVDNGIALLSNADTAISGTASSGLGSSATAYTSENGSVRTETQSGVGPVADSDIDPDMGVDPGTGTGDPVDPGMSVDPDLVPPTTDEGSPAHDMAGAAGVYGAYIVEGYNVLGAVGINHLNAGVVEQQAGVLTGTVFEDADYDGTYAASRTGTEVDSDKDATLQSDTDEADAPLAGALVGIKRFVYNPSHPSANAQGWVPDPLPTTDPDDESLENPDDIDPGMSVDPFPEVPDGGTGTGDPVDPGMSVDPFPEVPDGGTGTGDIVDPGMTNIPNDGGTGTGEPVDPGMMVDPNAPVEVPDGGTGTGDIVDPGMSVDPDGSGSVAADDDEIDPDMGVDPLPELPEGVDASDYLGFTFTDENGVYTFGDLPTYGVDEQGNTVLYGYELWLLDAGDDTLVPTRYEVGAPAPALDSALEVGGRVRLSGADARYEVMGDKIVLAFPVDDGVALLSDDLAASDADPVAASSAGAAGVDASFILEGYNILRATAPAGYDMGLTPQQHGAISGTVFEDGDYDGQYEAAATDAGSNVDVPSLARALRIETAAYDSSMPSAAALGSALNPVPGTDDAALAGAVVGLRRYIWVADPSSDFGSPEDGIAAENGSLRTEDDLATATAAGATAAGHWMLDDPEVVDGGMGVVPGDTQVLAGVNPDEFVAFAQIGTDGTYSFDNLDTHVNTDGANQLYGYEVSLVALPAGRDLVPTRYGVGESAELMSALEVGGLLSPVNAEGNAQLKDGKIVLARAMSDAAMPAASEADDLLPSAPQPGASANGVHDYYAVEGYDVVGAIDVEHLNAGLAQQQTGVLAGTVFEDADYDGLYAAGGSAGTEDAAAENAAAEDADSTDAPIAGALLGVRRFAYLPGTEGADEQGWVLDVSAPEADTSTLTGEGDTTAFATGSDDPIDPGMSLDPAANLPEGIVASDYLAFTYTGEDGAYSVTGLPTHRVEADGTRTLYGYELWVLALPEGGERLVPTRYQLGTGDGELIDSALTAGNRLVRATGAELPEVLGGKIVLGLPVGEAGAPADGVDASFIAEGYNTVRATMPGGYDAGLVENGPYQIDGMVYEDADRSGAWDEGEQPLAEVTVQLERFYLQNGAWHELAEEPVSMPTDEDGRYVFADLPLTAEVDGAQRVLGYRVKVPELPAGYVVAARSDAERAGGTALSDATGYIEQDGESLLVLADELAEGVLPEYANEGYNMSHGAHASELHAGLLVPEPGSIAGVVYDDANGDGLFDDAEDVFAGETVQLERRVRAGSARAARAAASEAAWEPVENGEAVTDSNGAFRFDNLPYMDENGDAYEYRLRTTVPQDRTFLAYAASEGAPGSARQNLLAQADPSEGLGERAGVTSPILLAQSREDTGFYQQPWHADGRSVPHAYLGYGPTEGTVLLQGTKAITGTDAPALEAGDFTFAIEPLAGAPEPASDTAVVNGSGVFSFAVNFTRSGTYRYLVNEVIDGDQLPGVSYDPVRWMATVTVAQNPANLDELTASVAWERLDSDGTDSPATDRAALANVYGATAIDMPFTAVKMVENTETGVSDLSDAAGLFSFELEALDGAPAPRGAADGVVTATSSARGIVDFGSATFTETGTYRYRLREVVPTESDRLEGYAYDSSVWEATVTVTDVDGQGEKTGELRTSISWTRDGAPADASHGVVFTNRFTPADPEPTPGVVDVALGGSKTVVGEGAPALAAGDYQFALAPLIANAPVPGVTVVANEADGRFGFDAISFTAPGVYRYRVTEVQGSIAGMSYDGSVWIATVTVEQSGELLAARVDWRHLDAGGAEVPAEGSQGAAFVNEYDASAVDVALRAAKYVQNTKTGERYAPDAVGAFGFELAAVDGSPSPAGAVGGSLATVNDGDGNAFFGTVTFDEPGIYRYRVREVVPAANERVEGYAYDESAWEATATVTDVGGVLRAEVTWKRDGVDESVPYGVTFINRFTPAGAVEPAPRPGTTTLLAQTGDTTLFAVCSTLAASAASLLAGFALRGRRKRRDEEEEDEE